MKKILVVLLIAASFASCEKLMMPKPVGTSPNDVFENLWTAMSEGYVSFNQKQVNWDSVYKVYQPKIFDTMTERQLYDTCAEMLSVLQDERVVFKTPFAEYNYVEYKPFKENFNRTLMEREYWNGAEKTGPFIHRIIDSVAYLYYGSFDDEVKESQLDIVIKKLRFESDTIESIVFDIRNNEGGDIQNAFALLKRMGVDTSYTLTTVLYKTIYKQGPERDDFTEAQTAYLEQDTKTKFPKRFILLTNRYVKGTAALFAAGAANYANVRVYGDTTGGRVSRIVGHELPNGWQLNFPASRVVTDEGLPIEDGLPPNRQIDMDPTDEANGEDTIIEEALNTLK